MKEGCDVCGKSSQIHFTEEGGTKNAWCLDHAPEIYATTVAEFRASANAIAIWEINLAEYKRVGGIAMPGWRVIASDMFRRGIKYGRENPV